MNDEKQIESKVNCEQLRYKQTNIVHGKRKRGGQPGNKNAQGHGAPKGNQNAVGHGAPWGNTNALQHGRYSIYCAGNRRSLYLAALNYMDRHGVEVTYPNMIACTSILENARKKYEPNTETMWDIFLKETFEVFESLGIKSII